MATTKKPVQKKEAVKATKKPVKAVKKPVTKTKPVKPTAKKASSAKKAVVKTATKPTKVKTASMEKVVVDRMPLPRGGKLFVKATKRPTIKASAKKAAAKKHK